jgi:hypothetical protein
MVQSLQAVHSLQAVQLPRWVGPMLQPAHALAA